jgi:hypothetical protein
LLLRSSDNYAIFSLVYLWILKNFVLKIERRGEGREIGGRERGGERKEGERRGGEEGEGEREREEEIQRVFRKVT